MALRVAALSGSLRRGSYTTALLRAASEQAPASMEIAIIDGLAEIPHYNEDLRSEGEPAAVANMCSAFSRSDALIIATPEYNRSFPGVLKNALDWLSRPPLSPLANKAALILTVSPGAMGGGLAGYHLRQTLSVMGVHVLPGREFALGNVGKCFDANLVLQDEAVKSRLGFAMNDFARLANALSQRSEAPNCAACGQ